MSIIYNKIEYNCECHSFCNEITYISTEQDNSGYTTFYFDSHGVGKNQICLNDKDIEILKQIINEL